MKTVWCRILPSCGTLPDAPARRSCWRRRRSRCFPVYPLIREYLAGTTASGLYEARLGHEEFGGETHVYAPAYAEGEFREILEYADHIVFNSFTQWKAYGSRARAAGKSCGLRLNPECSTQPSDHAMYDPCGPDSRLGITIENFQPELLDGIEGFHFHTLCEQNSDRSGADCRCI